MAASTDKEIEDISQLRGEQQTWFEEDSYTATFSEIKKRLVQMNNKLKPINKRIEEAIKRPEAYKQTLKIIQTYYEKFENVSRNRTWLTEEQKNEFLAVYN